MKNLQDSAELAVQIGKDVIASVENFPKQLETSFQEALQLSFPDSYRLVKQVVVCGMGGSRFPAYIVQSLFKELLTVPYFLNDDYVLPGWVDESTLVILSSYSGTTEEVLTAGKLAQKKGAKLAGVAMGGEIVSYLQSLSVPVYQFNPVFNPSGQPRMGFGYGVGAQIGILKNLGFLKIEKEVILSAISQITSLTSTWGVASPVDQNSAKQLAEKLFQRAPTYIVSEFLTGVGNAVANQTNETAKSISSFRIIPELNHHLMEGLKFPDAYRTMATFVFFYSSLYSAPIQKRFHITKEVVEQNSIQTLWHELKGATKEEQAFELMVLGSWVSTYLSALYGQDAKSIPFVDYFKKKLKEMK